MSSTPPAYNFLKQKYDRELLIDLGTISETSRFVVDDKPFYTTFYEILFMTRGKGVFKLDDEAIPFSRGTVLLLPPNKWRQWYRLDEPFDGNFLIFEEDFISSFFNDALYLYRFHYFYNTHSPSYTSFTEPEFQSCLTKLSEIRDELQDLKPDSDHLLRS